MDNLIKPAYATAQNRNIVDVFPFAKLAGEDITLAYFVRLLLPIGFSVASLMVVFYFLIGAFELITSQGDKAHIISARAKIYHAMIGFLLLILLFLIMQYVPQALGIPDFKII